MEEEKNPVGNKDRRRRKERERELGYPKAAEGNELSYVVEFPCLLQTHRWQRTREKKKDIFFVGFLKDGIADGKRRLRETERSKGRGKKESRDSSEAELDEEVGW